MKLIDKSALIAEIKRRISLFKKEKKIEKWSAGASQMNVVSLGARIAMLEEILSLLDTLEVEEEDENEYINKYFKGWYVDLTDQGNILHTPDGNAGLMSVKEVARHFFELGMASQPTTSVYGIEEALKENGIDTDSKEADIYREAIYKIYNRLQALKGE